MRNLKTIIIIIILSLPLAVLSAPQCISLFQSKNKKTESQIETDNAAKIQYFEKLLNTVNALRITNDQSLLSESYVQLLRKNLRKELKT